MAAPVSYGLVGGILERLVAALHGKYLGAQHAHAFHVDVLTLHIQCTHIHTAGHIHQCAHGGSGHSVLSGTGLGYDALLSHAPCKQYLPDGIVYLVGTGVVQILALEVEPAAVLLAHALGQVQWTGPAHVVAQQLLVLPLEAFTLNDTLISQPEILHGLV